jgi:hypothetical protein
LFSTILTKIIMKKITLLIGVLAFVLHASAQPYTLYSDDFSGQTLGGTPQTTPFAGADDGHGPIPFPPPPQNMWVYIFGASSWTFDVERVLGPSGTYIHAAVLDWTVGPGDQPFFAFTIGPGHTTLAAGAPIGDLTFSFDIYDDGPAVAGATAPVTIWFDQFPGGVKTFDASISPTLTYGVWNQVSFTLDQLTPSGTSGAYDPDLGLSMSIDGGNGCSLTGGDTGQIMFSSILVTSTIEPLIDQVPEPGTIALLTLGGLGALVAVRRRRA